SSSSFANRIIAHGRITFLPSANALMSPSTVTIVPKLHVRSGTTTQVVAHALAADGDAVLTRGSVQQLRRGLECLPAGRDRLPIEGEDPVAREETGALRRRAGRHADDRERVRQPERRAGRLDPFILIARQRAQPHAD